MRNYFLIASMILPIWNLIPYLNQNIKVKTTSQVTTETNEADKLQEQLAHSWVLMEGSLDAEQMVFQKKDTSAHRGRMFSVFSFNANQSVDFELYNPEQYRICGVGMMHIQEGHWAVEDKAQILVSIKGEHFGTDQFEFKTQYHVEHIDEQTLRLRVVKRLKNEVVDFR